MQSSENSTVKKKLLFTRWRALTEEVDDEATVGHAAGGSMEVGAAVRGVDGVAESGDESAGVGVGVAEVEDDGASIGRLLQAGDGEGEEKEKQ